MGVWHDAKHLGEQIAIQRGYRAYPEPIAATPARHLETESIR
ncbi:hypothetical protein GCM10025875_25520 [Litorihabitans aurantiacus]|uniref:Uncharacterized protein n=1 Tax=Litorihabitans aurantiacus TaxID=1930061 RepID=A0AA38CV76_9MICO|nr:hypothetical protein GCM10025875_25520 [Litorihabitans aurantiacus]